jgi:hypothetical protein
MTEVKFWTPATDVYQRIQLGDGGAPGFVNFDMSNFAIDVAGRHMYAWYTDANGDGGAHLACFNLDTHEFTIKTAPSCQGIQTCPQTLVFA